MDSLIWILLFILAMGFLWLTLKVIWFLLPFIIIVVLIMHVRNKLRKGPTHNPSYPDEVVDVEFKVKDHDEN